MRDLALVFVGVINYNGLFLGIHLTIIGTPFALDFGSFILSRFIVESVLVAGQ